MRKTIVLLAVLVATAVGSSSKSITQAASEELTAATIQAAQAQFLQATFDRASAGHMRCTLVLGRLRNLRRISFYSERPTTPCYN